MQPRITEKMQIRLAGMSFYGNPFDSHMEWDEENQIGHLWKRFMDYYSRHPEQIPWQKHVGVCYEVHIYNEETRQKGLFEVFVGMEVEGGDFDKIPIDLSVKILPMTRYAVFTLKGEEINSDWEKIIEDWLQSSGFESSYFFSFQYYDERFKGLANLEESSMDVYIPIKKAA